MLDTPDKIGVTLPATVEQHLWGWNGETFGVTGNYVGVSWFDTKINVPADWRNKRIVMNVASVRFRAEIFVNKKLVGYDLVNSTPFAVDALTPFILPGQAKCIAFRITDPNGYCLIGKKLLQVHRRGRVHRVFNKNISNI